MTDEILSRKIKESFDNIKPDENKKAELYDTILLTMKEKATAAENKISFSDKLLSFFKTAVPYAAVCTCLILVCAIGFSGGFDRFFSMYTKTTGANVSLTADGMESRSYTAEACEEIPETALYSSAEDLFTEDEAEYTIDSADDSMNEDADCKEIYVFTQNRDSEKIEAEYSFMASEDPNFIWNEIKAHYKGFENAELLSVYYNGNTLELYFDSAFGKAAENKENTVTMVAIAKTFTEAFKDFEIKVYSDENPIRFMDKEETLNKISEYALD